MATTPLRIVVSLWEKLSWMPWGTKGIRRYGFAFDPRNPFTGEAYVPMDECLARCVIDFSGRPYLV